MKNFQELGRQAYNLLQQALSKYSTKYSRQDFTQHQRAVLLLIWAKYDHGYRGTVQFQGGFSGIDAIGFERTGASQYYAITARMNIKSIKTTVLANLAHNVVMDVNFTTTRKRHTHIGPQLLTKHYHCQRCTLRKTSRIFIVN